MQGFWREGKIIACSSAFSQVPRLIWQLMKCVMKSGRGKEDNSSRLQYSPHPEKLSFFCIPCFFCLLLLVVVFVSALKLKFQKQPSIKHFYLAFPHSSIFTDTAFNKNSSLPPTSTSTDLVLALLFLCVVDSVTSHVLWGSGTGESHPLHF